MKETNVTPSPPAAFIRYRTFIVVTSYALLIALALFSSFLLAYNFRWGSRQGEHSSVWFIDLYLPLLTIALPLKLLVFYGTRQFHGSWRYVGLRDLFGVISASLIGSFLFLSVYFAIEYGWYIRYGRALIDRWPEQYLRQSAVFALDWAATIAFVCAARILVRFYYEELHPRSGGAVRRVLICGAGNAGEAVLREILRAGSAQYDCVGFLDDDVPQLHGRIHDVPIVGRTAQIRELCEHYGVQEVLIALPDAGPRKIRQLVERCEGTGVLFRTMPALTDLIAGRVQVNTIREVSIADLLGREAVELDSDLIARELHGKRIMVTGAGGSIGSEMCRQIAAFGPQRLILIEQAENNLFEIDRELRARWKNLEICACVADITDRTRIEYIFSSEHPSSVFHAAAHKHVPIMEINPGEAIKNNILGTMVIADACLIHNVAKMVMISTDKAVNPTSVMGCTKRVAEMYVQGLTGQGMTHFVTVRFGNVLGSSGSVVPIFRQQIAAGGPVTVTHPDMTRYFMTIPEAAQLVLQAGTMGQGGEIFMLHMGEPVRILDLARDMITLSGLRPGVDIEIVFSGKRPGEKLFEELANEGENLGATNHPKIGIWKSRTENRAAVLAGIDRLFALADGGEPDEIKSQLKLIVPEYNPNGDAGSKPVSSRVSVVRA